MQDEITEPVEGIEQPTEEAQTEVAEASNEGTDSSIEEGEHEDGQVKEHNQVNYERRKRVQAERELSDLKNERLRQQVQQQVQPQQPAQQNAPVGDPNSPNLDLYLEQGKSTEEWVQDSYSYMDSKKVATTQRQTVVNTYTDRLREFAKTDPNIYDYDVDVSRIAAPHVAQAILNSEMGPQIVREMALDPALATKLNGFNDIHSLTREIIALEDRAKVKPSVSNAPEPIDSPRAVAPQGKKNISSGSQLSYDQEMNEYRRKHNI